MAAARAARLAALVGLGLAATATWAEPAGAGPEPARATAASPPAPSGAAAIADPLWQMLQQRGLLPTSLPEPPQWAQQVQAAAAQAVLSALNFLGVAYQRGGNGGDEGFDCSGFTRHVFQLSMGLMLPRRAEEQARHEGLSAVAKTELKPGDLVFFNTLRRAFSHVGIYIGEGRFIHAPRAGGEVRIESLRTAYWASRFDGARRADAAPGVTTPASATDPAIRAGPGPAAAPALPGAPPVPPRP